MGKTLIVGHKSPDTDSIASAIVMEDLENRIGIANDITKHIV